MRITVSGLTRTQERLRAAAARVRDLSPVLKPGAAAIVKLIDDSFREQRSPGGTPWVELSEATLLARMTRGMGTKKLGEGVSGPLQRVKNSRMSRAYDSAGNLRKRAAKIAWGAKALIDTGRLRGSIHAESGPRSITFGTNVEYAGPNQFGGKGGKGLGGRSGPKQLVEGRPPARPFLPVMKEGNRYVLMEGGPAGVAFQRIRERIAAYVTKGTR